MIRIPVTSEMIDSIGYNPTDAVMEIEFSNGSVYQYYGVPPQEYAEFMAAGSHGEYFHSNIKGTYRYQRVSG